ncbi:MAG: exonuclease domain-containing protein [Planctomycetaceae bacterium]
MSSGFEFCCSASQNVNHVMSRIAIIDVETTGLNPFGYDRVVEIAIISMTMDGSFQREFATLINPIRDIGPTSIHGISSSDVISAPKFEQVASHILKALNGCVALAAHNVKFDHSFLVAEFQRFGHSLPECPMLCTLRMSGGGNLGSCCALFGIEEPLQAHSALHDARATAKLLAQLLSDDPLLTAELKSYAQIVWPRIPMEAVAPITRDGAKARLAQPPSYIKRLVSRVNDTIAIDADDSAVVAYTALLDRILEDRRIDEEEVESLLEVATHWGLSGQGIRKLHNDYLRALAIVALEDDVVTNAERRDLDLVAQLLGVPQASMDRLLETTATELAQMTPNSGDASDQAEKENLIGQTVCFTGECICRRGGSIITREQATGLAIEKGLKVISGVTKKLDVLVVSDPHTQSGKAKKARQYGIRILHEPLFWTMLNVEVE